MFILLILALLFPIAQKNTDAMEVGLSTQTTVNLHSAISLSTSNAINIDVTPKSIGALGTGRAEVKVATNNTTGYQIHLATADKTNQLTQIYNTLQYSDSDDKYAINPLTKAVTIKDYLKDTANLNTWGYALTQTGPTDDTEYQGLTTSDGTSIYNTKRTTSDDTYELNIAVGVDAALPAGGYSNNLMITAIANPLVIAGFNQIHYMQHMTPEVCQSANIGDTGQLVDKRDNKIYWVAKLADENCWMTQNLDLDLTTVGLLAADSDLTHDWNSEYTGNGVKIDSATSEYAPTETLEMPVTAGITFGDDRMAVYSFDPGQWVAAAPSRQGFCDSIASIENCSPSNGFVNVAEWQPTFKARVLAENESVTLPNGGPTISGGQTIAVDVAEQTYDPHYLIGNYYFWGAATAGSGGTVTNGVAEASICPKGWRLPSDGSGVTKNGSLRQLFEKSGVLSNLENIFIEPFYLVRAGSVGGGRLYHVGLSAYVWSNGLVFDTESSSLKIYSTYITKDVSNTGLKQDPNIGDVVRCVAR